MTLTSSNIASSKIVLSRNIRHTVALTLVNATLDQTAESYYSLETDSGNQFTRNFFRALRKTIGTPRNLRKTILNGILGAPDRFWIFCRSQITANAILDGCVQDVYLLGFLQDAAIDDESRDAIMVYRENLQQRIDDEETSRRLIAETPIDLGEPTAIIMEPTIVTEEVPVVVTKKPRAPRKKKEVISSDSPEIVAKKPRAPRKKKTVEPVIVDFAVAV